MRTSLFASLLYSLLCVINAAATRSWHAVDQSVLQSDSPDNSTLHAVTSDNFTVLHHPTFSKYRVRIKRVRDFCDSTVRAYTGYVDVEAKHLFFYFFESRRNPAEDDVLMWINGGPGGSSALGLFMELGPCNIDSANSTTFNPYGWNNNANLLVLDQPVGVGFSYADHGETVTTTEDAAKDIAAFFAILVNSFSEFHGRPLHLAGESYAGTYIPLFAAEIYDQNVLLVEKGLQPVNLASMLLGNPGINNLIQLSEAMYSTQCSTISGLPAPQPIHVCVRMKQAVPRCQRALKQHCYDSRDYMNCQAAADFCDRELFQPFMKTGLNMYDISKPCGERGENTLCYPEVNDIAFYLNSSATRALLHTDAQPPSFESISWPVNHAFINGGDMLRDSAPHIGQLLDRGVRTPVYAGAYDLICSWFGTEATTRALEWHGQTQFEKQEMGEWKVEGVKAGLTRSWGDLTFASVYAAGHMVPHDKPREALALVNRWLAGESL